MCWLLLCVFLLGVFVSVCKCALVFCIWEKEMLAWYNQLWVVNQESSVSTGHFTSLAFSFPDQMD